VLWHCWLGGRNCIRPVKNEGWWRWAQVSPDGVAPSRMVGVSASVNLPLHHKVQKFSSRTSWPGWSWKKGRKTVLVWCGGKAITWLQTSRIVDITGHSKGHIFLLLATRVSWSGLLVVLYVSCMLMWPWPDPRSTSRSRGDDCQPPFVAFLFNLIKCHLIRCHCWLSGQASRWVSGI